MITLYVPRDSASRSVGADEVAERLAALLPDARIVRNGSRGMLWLEPLVEIDTPDGRVAYGPVLEADLDSLAAALLADGEHPLRLGLTGELPWLASQERLTFARVGVIDPLDPDDYLGVFYSGGRAPEYIRYDEHLVRITRSFFAANKPVAMVCHGVEIPAYAGCLRGRRVTTVAKCRHDVETAGGTYVDAPCVVDGNLVSGRTYPDNGRYLGPWVRLLEAARRAGAA